MITSAAKLQQVFRDIRDEIVEIISENTDPSSTKVFNRNVFDDDERVWLGRLVAPNGKIHCWTVHYAGCPGLDDPQNPVATETFVPMFRMTAYRGFDFGTNANNSADDHLDELNQLRWTFMQNPVLNLPDYVESHSGFIDQTILARIDTKSVHMSSINLGVQLHPIPYNYPS